jgi:opacity protein-like surface antigen
MRDVSFDTAASGGIRVGGYFEALPVLGLAVDVLQFYPNIAPQTVQLEGCFALTGCGTRQGGTGSFDISTTAVSFDLMLRLPLMKTADAPTGVIQPYVGVGLPLFVTSVSPRNTPSFRNHASDTDFSFGYMAAGGVAVRVYKALAVFAEYRFNHTHVGVDLQDSVSAAKATFRTDLDSHSTLIGISARW